jgi:hypothetical protein
LCIISERLHTRNSITEFHSTLNIVSVSYLDVENQPLSMIHFCHSFKYVRAMQ